MSIPNAWLEQITDKDAFIAEVDPDWEDHFSDVDLALDFYSSMDPKEFLDIQKRLK